MISFFSLYGRQFVLTLWSPVRGILCKKGYSFKVIAYVGPRERESLFVVSLSTFSFLSFAVSEMVRATKERELVRYGESEALIHLDYCASSGLNGAGLAFYSWLCICCSLLDSQTALV